MFKLKAPIDRPDLRGETDLKGSNAFHEEAVQDTSGIGAPRTNSRGFSVKTSIQQQELAEETPDVDVDGKDQERTDLFGQPVKQQHSVFGRGVLPPGFTDESIVHVPIRVSEFDPLAAETASYLDPRPEKKRSWRERLSLGSGNRKRDVEIKIVPMTRADYLRFWAKGQDGQWLPSVVDPPEGRAEWLKRQLEKRWVEEEDTKMREKHHRYDHQTKFGIDVAAGISSI